MRALRTFWFVSTVILVGAMAALVGLPALAAQGEGNLAGAADLAPLSLGQTEPGASANIVTFQYGVNGYVGTRDAWLVSWYPNRVYNRANNDTMEIRTDDQLAGLLRFDLRSIPKRSTVTRATLSVYVPERYGPREIKVGVYKVLRRWFACSASWSRAKGGTPWAMPGANGIGIDREGIPVDEVTMFEVCRWYDFDLTDLVQGWVRRPVTNDGLALKAYGNAAGIKIVTMEHGGTWMHPKLTVEFTAP